MQAYSVILLSTVHEEIGKCNLNELYRIIESVNPDVIFLEALENTYSKYDQMLFSKYGVYHKRLEIKAIQVYGQNHDFEYVPVLDIELSEAFEKKNRIATENWDDKKIIDYYNSLETSYGFEFLNSKQQVALQEEMRELENRLIDNKTILQKANESIDAYEHSMLRNIYSFSKQKSFN